MGFFVKRILRKTECAKNIETYEVLERNIGFSQETLPATVVQPSQLTVIIKPEIARRIMCVHFSSIHLKAFGNTFASRPFRESHTVELVLQYL